MIKTIKKSDIHWRNVPLIVKFLNEAGKIMNRYQTRLPTSTHRRLAKVVKHARNLGLLPFNDFLKPHDKLPLTSLRNEFFQDVSQTVDPKTGKIQTLKSSLTDKFTYSHHDSTVDASKEQEAA